MKSIDEMIAVMEASKTKEIECSLRCSDDWVDSGRHIIWDWCNYDYRVKVKDPRRMVGLEDDTYALIEAYPDLNRAAREFQGNIDAATKVEFIELTPEIRERLGL